MAYIGPHEGDFRANYNRSPFSFSHDLKASDLFCMSSFKDLAARMPREQDKYWQNGRIAVDDNWETAKSERRSLADTLETLESNNSLVILKHIEQDPVYAPVLKELFREIFDLTGPRMRHETIMGRATLLLTSPKRVTAYHMDADCNYLFQVSGEKKIYVFDQTDPTVVPPSKVAEFHAGNKSCLKMNESLSSKGHEYDLRPGVAVHVPVYAPHWVQNDDNVSISLSINFELKPTLQHARILWANRWLGKLGLSANEPGASPWADGIKLTGATMAMGLRDRLKTTPYQLWTPESVYSQNRN
jgi:hypothetical protein